MVNADAKKKEGFKNQRTIVLPVEIANGLLSNPLTKLLFVTDIGYYQSANNHFRDRPNGSEEHILIYCVDGNGWVETSEGRKQISKNMYFSIPTLLPHTYGTSQNNPWTIYWIHFSGEMSHLLCSSNFMVGSMEYEPKEVSFKRIALFEDIYYNLSIGFGTEHLEYASTCLWNLLGTFKYSDTAKHLVQSQNSSSLDRVVAFMHENIDRKLTLEELATVSHHSIPHFSMSFKKKTSRSPIDYFNYLKVQKACQMLDFTDLHINEIAEKLSYVDPFYFSRLFKKVMGIAPRLYRLKEKG